MSVFINHKVENDQDGYIVSLFLNKNDTEFSNELGNTSRPSENWQDSIKNYLNEKLPNVKVKAVKIMLGTIVVSSFAINGAEASSASTETLVTETHINQTYVVKAGDTLSVIAKKYNVSVVQLKTANQLTSDLIGIGQVLTIPKLESTIVQNIPANTSTHQPIAYTVVAGDSLSLIGKKFGVSVDQIKQTNHLTTDMIRIGQTLMINKESETTSTPITESNTVASEETGFTPYTVVSGDNLWAIAQRFGTNIEALRSLNHLQSTILQIGQQLKIPANSTNMQPTEGSANTTSIQPSEETNKPINNTYTVVAGDSLSVIAKKLNTSVTILKQINGLTTDMILIGQVLQVPATVNQEKIPTAIPAPNTSTVDNVPVSTIQEPETVKTPDTDIQFTQKNLQVLGYYAVPTITGSFDSATDQAIRSFQKDYGLPVTGSIDAATKTAIDHALVKKEIVADTINYQGVPYKWGGTTPTGFDCSGFVYFMFNSHNVPFQRTSSDMLYQKGISVSKDSLQPGDLVFFGVNTPGVVSHVGFYAGDNNFISATSSKGIWVYSMDNIYWTKYYIGAKRVY